jgi:hypothetical protein
MHEKARAELERRGRNNVRLLLETAAAGGYGRGAVVNLELSASLNPLRDEVEAWLQEQDDLAARIQASRHDQLLFWGRVAGFAAISAVAIGIIGIVITYLAWKHPIH